MEKISHDKLKTIDHEFPDYINGQKNEIINNIKYSDIDTEEKYQKKLSEIKEELLLKPVKFSEPKITDHVYGAQSSQVLSGPNKYYDVTVEIEFEGDKRLFNYKPNGYNISTNMIPYVFQPKDNVIIIQVRIGNITDKQPIFKRVNEEMELTKLFIQRNNSYIENWNEHYEEEIERYLEEHKGKLDKLYN